AIDRLLTSRTPDLSWSEDSITVWQTDLLAMTTHLKKFSALGLWELSGPEGGDPTPDHEVVEQWSQACKGLSSITLRSSYSHRAYLAKLLNAIRRWESFGTWVEKQWVKV
ncbi:hypothetical protein B0H14DRAFT_2658981, partial [Mycena olivaceomarginata]